MPYNPNNPYVPGDPYAYDLKWIVSELKKAIALYEPLSQNFTDLYNYVHDYFDHLDVDSVIRAKIDEMAEDGTLQELIAQAIASEVADQLPIRRNFILIGDSLGLGITPGVASTEWKGWIYWAKRYITENTNSLVYDTSTLVAEGNSGFASSLPFTRHLEYAYTDLVPELKRAAITDIVVLGGTNDATHEAYIEAGIIDFMDHAKVWFPNAKVNIGVLGSGCFYNYNNIYPEYKKCMKHGANFIHDTVGLCGLPRYISSDGVHLTQEGYEFYSTYITEAILTSKCKFSFQLSVPLTLPYPGLVDSVDADNLRAYFDIRENGYSFGIYAKSSSTPSLTQAAQFVDKVDYNTVQEFPILRLDGNAPHICRHDGRFHDIYEFASISGSGCYGGVEIKPVVCSSLVLGGMSENTFDIYLSRAVTFFTLSSGDFSHFNMSGLHFRIPYTETFVPY